MKFVSHGFLALVTASLLSACISVRDGESLENRVSRLVDQTTKSEKIAQKAFVNLESLGNQAVPYLVAHLGDIRPLAAAEISLKNKASDAFESERHYEPETVHDALAAILSQITGRSFVIVYNGAMPQEREENRNKWVEWCRSAFPNQAEICMGK